MTSRFQGRASCPWDWLMYLFVLVSHWLQLPLYQFTALSWSYIVYKTGFGLTLAAAASIPVYSSLLELYCLPEWFWSHTGCSCLYTSLQLSLRALLFTRVVLVSHWLQLPLYQFTALSWSYSVYQSGFGLTSLYSNCIGKTQRIILKF